MPTGFIPVGSTMTTLDQPELTAGRWGQGLNAEKMEECVWQRPEVVAQAEFLEWTGADHLRHTKFIGLREDKEPFSVVWER
jgi:ATP-dependent DNA ligase